MTPHSCGCAGCSASFADLYARLIRLERKRDGQCEACGLSWTEHQYKKRDDGMWVGDCAAGPRDLFAMPPSSLKDQP